MIAYNVLNLGAGWQSTRILLASCRGELPKFDAAVFADTQWEPKAVYHHLEWLKGHAEKAGIPLIVVTRGDLRADGIEFREKRASSDNKRFASIPVFVKNLNGTQGRVRRQCTREYKIDAVDGWIRRVLLGLEKRQRWPAGVLVRQWFGISDDESRRAVFPGRWKTEKIAIKDLFGNEAKAERRTEWVPVKGKEHVYPLLNEVWTNDRKITQFPFFPHRQTRQDVGQWLREQYPDRNVPRSACIGCPFRTNEEWERMRAEAPDEFEDACQFDEAIRTADRRNAGRRQMMVGELFLHRQLIPLRLVDLSGPGEAMGGGCGSLFDGQDGLCGV